MVIVFAAVAVLLFTALLAAVIATRWPGRRPDELEPPPAPSSERPVAPPPGEERPAVAPPETRSRPPAGAEIDRQAAELVAEAEAMLAQAGGAAPAAEPDADADVAGPLEAVPEPEAPPEEPVRPRFRDRLGKARSLFAGYLGSVRSRAKIDEETWDELEEALIRADVGMSTATALLDDLRRRVQSEGIQSPDELVDALKTDLKKSLAVTGRDLRFEPGPPNVWLFVGVNGVGKTTTIGKVGRQQ